MEQVKDGWFFEKVPFATHVESHTLSTIVWISLATYPQPLGKLCRVFHSSTGIIIIKTNQKNLKRLGHFSSVEVGQFYSVDNRWKIQKRIYLSAD